MDQNNRNYSALVYGSGSWGSALGSYLSSIGINTLIYSRDFTIYQEINSKQQNQKYLGQISLHKSLNALHKLDNLENFQLIVIAVPSTAFDLAIQHVKSLNPNSNLKFLIATKGFASNPTQLLSEKFSSLLQNDFAFISGPNLAEEVALSYYSSANIASYNLDFAKDLSQKLSSNSFVIDYNSNVILQQIASALKNIFAIKTGILSYEKNFGHNAIASLMVQYLNEISNFTALFGDFSCNLVNYSVIGDLLLTNYSSKSRNRKFGFEVRQHNFDPKFIAQYPILVEGLNALKLTKYFIKDEYHRFPHINSLYHLFNLS